MAIRDRRATLGSPCSSVIDLDLLVPTALTHSKQIQVARLDPFIELEQVMQQDAQFDWTVFLQNLWIDTDEPTGSDLEGGAGIRRLLQEDLTLDGGFAGQIVLVANSS